MPPPTLADFDAAALDQAWNDDRERTMRQNILSVALEVNPESAGNLSLIIETLKQNEENPGQGMAQSYDGLKAGVPALQSVTIRGLEVVLIQRDISELVASAIHCYD